MRDRSGGSQGLALSSDSKINSRSMYAAGMSSGRLSALRSKLKNREVSERKQVGDAESMINEQQNVSLPGGASEWLE